MFPYFHDNENSSGRPEIGAAFPSLLISLCDESLLHSPSDLPISALDGKMSTSMTFTSLYNHSLVCMYVPDGR